MTSSIRPLLIPEWVRALSADWAPGPGVLVLFLPVARSLMWRAMTPSSLHLWATSWAANMAAYGEDSSRSAFTFIPPITWQMVSLPERSVSWIKVLLRDAKMWHTPNIFSPSAEADDLFFLLFLPLARCHFCASSPDSATGNRFLIS